jgi:hypothetical protein
MSAARPRKQCNVEWLFDEHKGMILHEDDQEDEHDTCDICEVWSRHYLPENGKDGSLDEARSARDHWFRENVLASLKDSDGYQELAAKTRELKQVRGELPGKCFETEQVRTRVKITEKALEHERRENTNLNQEKLLLQQSRDKEDMEHRHLQEEFEGQEKQQCVSFARMHARLSKGLEERGAFHRDLKIAQRELDNTRLELEDVRQELRMLGESKA